MVLRRLVLALLLIGGVPAAAEAHTEQARAKAEQSRSATGKTVAHPMSPEVHAAVKDDLARLEAEAARPWHRRLTNWLGRTHPFAVHFPLALFPIAWAALMLARRRGDTEPLIRSIIVVAGGSAAVAGALGWLNGGFALTDADPILMWHRWLGTALGIAGLAIAIWSWRKASAAHSRAMAWALGLATLALLVQGWFGGALVHGVDHMNW